MNRIIKKFKSLSFEERTVFSAEFSIIFNAILAIGKIILSIFQGIFFMVAGILNILFLISKLECFMGVKYPHKKTFRYRNIATGVFLILAGIQYAIYMGRMIYANIEPVNYGGFLSVCIATVAFVEMAIAIIGCFKVYGKGHYFRNLKIINLCSAMTAIVLTEVALMTFASETDSRLISGIFGLVVGIIISILGIFIIIAPKISIVDREHNIYKVINHKNIVSEKLEIKLTNSKFYGNYYYKASVNGDIVDGHIVKKKSPIAKWNIYIKILVIVLSEILIFPYAVGALVYYFKNAKLIDKLDSKMTSLGCVKIKESEE